MKKYITALFSFAIIAAAGCASFGDQAISSADQAMIDRYIVDGKTTMADVRAVFGPTSSKNITDTGGEFWYYAAVHQSLTAVNVKTLTVTFNSHGLVTSHSFAVKSKSA